MMAAVKEIQSISTMEELTDFICDTEKNWEIATFVDFENTPDLEDASSYVVGVWTDGFFLGDAAEYKNRTEYGSRRYESNKKLVSGMLQRAGYTQAEGESLFDRVIPAVGRRNPLRRKAAERNSTDGIHRIACRSGSGCYPV